VAPIAPFLFILHSILLRVQSAGLAGRGLPVGCRRLPLWCQHARPPLHPSGAPPCEPLSAVWGPAASCWSRAAVADVLHCSGAAFARPAAWAARTGSQDDYALLRQHSSCKKYRACPRRFLPCWGLSAPARGSMPLFYCSASRAEGRCLSGSFRSPVPPSLLHTNGAGYDANMLWQTQR